ncbi:hypothetical protein AB7T25_003469 [Salmonella enterica]
MQQVKIYTAPPSDLSPPVQPESFCVDMVLASDYAELEEKFMALAAENAALKKSEAEFNEYCRHECEDAGYTWVDDFTETPATYAFLAEMRAQALEQFAVQQESISEKYPAGSYGQESAYDAAQCAREFAEQLRQETAQ